MTSFRSDGDVTYTPPENLMLPIAAALRGKSGPIGVALSGGADSAMLAVAADAYARQYDRALHFFHVHHGLLEQADAWADHVRTLAVLLNRPLHVSEVRVAMGEGRGMEAAARDARYAAINQCARESGVGVVLLAHHRDDQAETVLLRLLRGAGVNGMGAMKRERLRDDVLYVRPWLDIDRADIVDAAQAFAAATQWAPVQDPTNTDPRYTRAAVRTQLTPLLNARWPGWQAVVSRHARQSEEAADILAEVAQSDLLAVADGVAPAPAPTSDADSGDGLHAHALPSRLDLKKWRALSAGRQKNVLRHWLALHGSAMPSEARLLNLQRQLMQLHAMGHDRNLTVYHGVLRIQCIRGKIIVQKISPR